MAGTARAGKNTGATEGTAPGSWTVVRMSYEDVITLSLRRRGGHPHALPRAMLR